MKKLVKIILINWYLFEADEIAVDGHILVVGPNGSGKTSLQDAVQVAMLGAHGSMVDLNANASKKRNRSIAGYCLGTVREEDEKGQSFRARDDAITYIALVFRDSELGEYDSVGVCLSAKSSTSKHQTEGLFILPGHELNLEDLLTNDLPITWENFRQEALRQASSASEDCYLFNHPEKYIEQMCYTLSPSKRIISKEKYVRSLRRAVNLRDIDDVSDFVKHRVLDDWPINVERMRQSEQVYQEMHTAAKKTKERIDELRAVQGHFQKASSALSSATAHRWVDAEHRCLDIGEHSEVFLDRIESAEQDIKALEQVLCTYEKEAVWLQEEINRLSTLIKADRSERHRVSLQKEQTSLDADLTQQHQYLANVRAELERVAMTKDDCLPEMLGKFVRTVASLVPQSTYQGLDLIPWPQNPESVDKVANVLATQVQERVRELEDYKQGLHGKEALLKNELEELRANHARLSQGRAALSKNTRTLMAYLEEHGIKSMPVCDLAAITDPEWQPAIEAYLSSNAEALYVEPKQSEDAIKLYRSIGRKKGLYGATVLNPFIIDSWNDTISRESCAGLVASDNRFAAKFLQRITKNLLRVETAEQLIKEPLAMTKDGMLSSNGGIKRLYKNGLLKIGAEARKASLKHLEVQIHEAANQYSKLKTTVEYLKENATKNIYLANTVLSGWKSVTGITMSVEKNRTRLSVIVEELEQLGQSEHLEGLKKERGKHSERQENVTAKVNETNQNIGKKRGEIGAHNTEVSKLEAELIAAKIIRAAIEAEEDCDVEKSSDIDARLCEKMGDIHTQICEEARKTTRQQEGISSKQLQDAEFKLGEYCVKNEDQPRLGSNKGEKVIWVAEHLALLEDSVLVGYEERAKEALHEAKRHFRSDVSLQLRENIVRMKRMIDELNNSLKHHPFSGNETYSFTYKKAQEHINIIKYIEELSEFDGANAGTLFDSNTGIDEDVIEAFKNSAEITDYRNLFRYDILVKDPDHNKHGTPLSRRLGSASGGEHRTPYYVSIGASLASAYRLEHKDGQPNGGFSLALFDEAFEKMDDNNSCQAAQYLAELGLQLFLAAPDSDELKLTPIVDTIIYMRRNGLDLELETYKTKPPLKELLKSDNIREHPELLEKTLALDKSELVDVT